MIDSHARLSTRPPFRLAPNGSWDCQIHVFGDLETYPVRNMRAHYEPPKAGIDDAWRIHRTLGFEKIVIVQPAPYGTDHRLLVRCLKDDPGNLRGVAIIDDDVSDAEIARLHEVGVRAARFNFWPLLGITVTVDSFKRTLNRIKPFGWHAKVFVSAAELEELYDTFRSVTDTTMVLDHMCLLPCAAGVAQPGVRAASHLLQRENWWVMLSNGDRTSEAGFPWADAEPIIAHFYRTAPNRSIWCSDWPRVGYQREMPDEADVLELLYRSLPDAEDLRAVLVDNPRRLFQ